MSTLDPDAFGIDVARRLFHRLHAMSARFNGLIEFRITSDDTATVSEQLASTDAAAFARQLCRWAQTGGVLMGADPVHDADAVLEVIDVVLGDAGVDAEGPLPDDPNDPVELVARAAHTRLALVEGEAVGAGDLAVLADLGTVAVRALVRSGEIRPLRSGNVGAGEAQRWLCGRGVKGFKTPGRW